MVGPSRQQDRTTTVANEPELTERGRKARDERAQKLARAMRDNLRRRKEQTRAREAAERTAEPPEDRG